MLPPPPPPWLPSLDYGTIWSSRRLRVRTDGVFLLLGLSAMRGISANISLPAPFPPLPPPPPPSNQRKSADLSRTHAHTHYTAPTRSYRSSGINQSTVAQSTRMWARPRYHAAWCLPALSLFSHGKYIPTTGSISLPSLNTSSMPASRIAGHRIPASAMKPQHVHFGRGGKKKKFWHRCAPEANQLLSLPRRVPPPTQPRL